MINWLIELVVNSIVVSTILSTIIFSIIYIYKKNKGRHFKHKIVTFIFVFYLIALLYVTVYREGLFMNTTRVINLEPLTILLWSFENLLYVDTRSAYLFLLYNVGGNIIWFIPFGLCINYFIKTTNFIKVLCYSFLLSLAIESVQYLCYVGISDIDDLIFNTIGGCIGYVIYCIIYRKKGEQNVNQKTSEEILESISRREK
ncbi:glycopeptide antibiotics resistance protein [Breznakia sp. PF5-3]|uniref:VanZ family protein n=1 Tax=unclassified Breznakia TaxID=2623764 RepID=UPI0024069205|nr:MULTISPECIES: VanZ family protein [unclassified Breznakia]MDF9824073.1 glycopeptide antibiotics resistance protein [Breznakia sp. PM6-1]MDF9834861.1 glycopeptide antibiotics resistance protein [Breznakia sp. PF5-3]MDF9837117.1 glycopeptide antibiotics resistance protein [Breznakia sp. PFB2-8]MDF9859042.1 glycopeptide antibiotics resistance protein [Breznakia sp. PH5-24]